MQGNAPDEEYDDPHGQCAAEIRRLNALYAQAVKDRDEWHSHSTRWADTASRLEKERFKYETCLMLISKSYPDPAGLAEAALAKVETV